MCNIEKRREGIDWSSLPKTFQDAVTVTRKLGVRFLWIDSLCIIQPHEGCSNECGGSADWAIEAKKMETYYSSAYCTIAATSARDSKDGFLDRPSRGQYVKIPDASPTTLYLCEAIDDFHGDVEERELNQRGWVLQERALSRRTIHFTAAQTYWECGRGIHCETLTRMHNSRALLLSDPQFPRSALDHAESYRVRLFEILFERYSQLAFTVATDRPIAISGLETRLARTLDTDVKYGIFGRYLHRCLLWQRSGDEMERIAYPPRQRVPSWSWMAYKCEISYMHIPFDSVEWNNAVRWQPDEALGLVLEAPARRFSLNKMGRRQLNFDEPNRTGIQTLMCIVVGRDSSWLGPSRKQQYHALIITPVGLEQRGEYERVGVGTIQRGDISFKGPEVEVRII